MHGVTCLTGLLHWVTCSLQVLHTQAVSHEHAMLFHPRGAAEITSSLRSFKMIKNPVYLFNVLSTAHSELESATLDRASAFPQLTVVQYICDSTVNTLGSKPKNTSVAYPSRPSPLEWGALFLLHLCSFFSPKLSLLAMNKVYWPLGILF